MLEIAILLGLMNATVITVMEKSGLRDYLQVHSPGEVFYQLISCNFCLGFWMSAAEVLAILFISMPPYEYFFIPLASATITKFMT
jgi:hypothetical protein